MSAITGVLALAAAGLIALLLLVKLCVVLVALRGSKPAQRAAIMASLPLVLRAFRIDWPGRRPGS
ncbi:hypothetical protein [Pseudonocardia humida]|uniref:Uncharacterized protein n=1 Tax=Pseudonocardia humida TaxID=2800819 RepID=A0ABT1AA41_9PSEU|nr:hypothetical protein [Pseudonocardia humida]MCO1659684.1 hypothetical protein [Pseudonocardia humida]